MESSSNNNNTKARSERKIMQEILFSFLLFVAFVSANNIVVFVTCSLACLLSIESVETSEREAQEA